MVAKSTCESREARKEGRKEKERIFAISDGVKSLEFGLEDLETLFLLGRSLLDLLETVNSGSQLVDLLVQESLRGLGVDTADQSDDQKSEENRSHKGREEDERKRETNMA